MAKSILITGGARSGKSQLGERLARHRAGRGADWTTREAPRELLSVLAETDGAGAPRLVDYLTLWLSNLMLGGAYLEGAVAALCDRIPALQAPVVFVTNEVGSGIVADNALARAFRDAAGITNQRVAAACDELWFCVAGHPLRVKPA